MPEPIKPGFMPKVALTAARIVDKPFEVPGQMTTSAIAAGSVSHMIVARTNDAVRQGVEFLQPRGPAKALAAIFARVDKSVAESAQLADHNVTAIWKPLSESSAKLGQTIANPGAAWYATKVGFENPHDPELLARLVHSTGFPTPTPQPAVPPAQAPADDAPPAQAPATPPAADDGAAPAPAPAAPPADNAPVPVLPDEPVPAAPPA